MLSAIGIFCLSWVFFSVGWDRIQTVVVRNIKNFCYNLCQACQGTGSVAVVIFHGFHCPTMSRSSGVRESHIFWEACENYTSSVVLVNSNPLKKCCKQKHIWLEVVGGLIITFVPRRLLKSSDYICKSVFMCSNLLIVILPPLIIEYRWRSCGWRSTVLYGFATHSSSVLLQMVCNYGSFWKIRRLFFTDFTPYLPTENSFYNLHIFSRQWEMVWNERVLLLDATQKDEIRIFVHSVLKLVCLVQKIWFRFSQRP